MYVVDRDFGFAPNPFHGACTLATCKPGIRKSAEIGDWVVGMGGARLKATGCCVFAMRVGRKLTFNQYWADPDFLDKRPVRNGSNKMLVGDSIYHRSSSQAGWVQENSHHSMADGSVNRYNLVQDTKVDSVLVSDLFYYFGKSAPQVPPDLLSAMGYKNRRNYRRFPFLRAQEDFIKWFSFNFHGDENIVSGDPFDFEASDAHYDVNANKITS